jgi:dephospho-CoA kinase
MLRVGLTGGIACGKTHVARRLASHGMHVLDLDAVAHEVTAPGGSAYADVVAAFGPGIVGRDGAIDRKALGARVFSDPHALGRLNALVHPRVRAEEARRAAELAGSDAVLVTDAALLVEAGLHTRFDRLVVVDCRPEEQLARVAAREGMTEVTARARIAAQMPLAEKRRFAHFVVDASATVPETDRQVDELAERLRALAAAPPAAVAVPRERALAALLHGPERGPRGLSPAALLDDVAEGGGLEVDRLARRLSPRAPGPWYRAADIEAPGPPPATLCAAVALWGTLRRGDDPDYTASVAATVARLTHRDPHALADATLLALAAAAAGLHGLDEARRRWAGSVRLAERWGGAPPTHLGEQVLVLALRQRDDPAAARAAAPEPVGPLAGALAGIGIGTGA